MSWNSGDYLQGPCKAFLIAYRLPMLVKGLEIPRRIISCRVHPRKNHFGHPFDLGILFIVVLSGKGETIDVMEVRIAYLGVCVPPIHRIDRL